MFSDSRRASDINFEKIKNFDKNEFPGKALDNMTAGIIYVLSSWRQNSGVAMTPSPIEAGHIRRSSGSRHDITSGRLSDATDIFVSWRDYTKAFMTGIGGIGGIGGFGIYFGKWLYRPDNITPMFHIDTRDSNIKWCWLDGKYYYMRKNESEYFRAISEGIKKYKKS